MRPFQNRRFHGTAFFGRRRPAHTRTKYQSSISSGYDVDTAADGADAWKALKTHRYDLLITDNKMPRVTGLELIKKLRSEGMTLPVILASVTMPTEELKRHPWLQLDPTLPKPFTSAELLDMVKKVLGAAASVAHSAQLFRDCAMLDNKILQAEKPAKAPIRDPINPSRRILVVDDDNDTRQLSVDVLAGSGYDVEGVKDGAAGWKALRPTIITTSSSLTTKCPI